MLTWDFFKHYLLSKRAGSVVRTVAWLCIVGVAIGVTSLIVVLSVMNGFNRSIQRRLLAVEPHLVVTIPNIKTAEQIELTPLYHYLLKQNGVQTEAYESQDILIRTVDGTYGGGVARGVAGDSLNYIMREAEKAELARSGPLAASDVPTAPLSAESSHLEAGEAIMGVDLARSLGVFEGDEIVVIAPEGLLLPAGEIPHFERLKIRGLITTNVPEVDGKLIYYGRGKSLLQLRDSSSREVGIELRLPNPEDYSGLKTEIEKRGGQVSTWVERNSSLFYALRLEKICMGTFLGLSALIASFSIVTVLVLLLMQKRQDIGSLMAMGLSARGARFLFLRLGLLLSAGGFGGGLAIGLSICYIIQRYPLSILPNIYYDTTIPARVDPGVILLVSLFSLLIAFFGAWWPAKAHTSLTPAEALRSRE
jgi:lipoprotein-releasing system permease protein